jgi:hypothetical protein
MDAEYADSDDGWQTVAVIGALTDPDAEGRARVGVSDPGKPPGLSHLERHQDQRKQGDEGEGADPDESRSHVRAESGQTVVMVKVVLVWGLAVALGWLWRRYLKTGVAVIKTGTYEHLKSPAGYGFAMAIHTFLTAIVILAAIVVTIEHLGW